MPVSTEPGEATNGAASAPPVFVHHHGVVLLPSEELHLRYVTVTRAQGVCTAPQWLEPLFGDLAEFCRAHPGFVLVGNHTELLSQQVVAGEQAQGTQEQVELVGVSQAEVVAQPAVRELSQVAPTEQQPFIVPSSALLTPTVPSENAAGPEDVFAFTPLLAPPTTTPTPTAPVNQPDQAGAGCAPGAPSQVTYQWFLGAVDPQHLAVLTDHYSRRYPGLCWDWLLQELSALRVVSGDPRSAVGAFLDQHQLGSALALVERFLSDLGLVVVEPTACHQQVGNGESPVIQQVDGVAADAEPGLSGQATAASARRSVRQRLVKLFT